MPQPQLEALTKRMDEVSAQYEANFAGHPRQTRSLSQLDRLILRTREIQEDLDKLPAAPESETLRTQVAGNLKVYEAEREAIAAAQAAGPDFEEAAGLAGFANSVFGRYHRHFAGQSRGTRDLGLMDEMIADLTHVRDGMRRLAAANPALQIADDLKLVTDNLTMYQSERAEIVKAQRGDGTQQSEASILASLANGQMAIYQQHFAGHSRLGRRPALLVRVITGMRSIGDRMRAVWARGLRLDWHDRNLEIVTSNLALYEKELIEVRKAREGIPLPQLLDHLGQEANEVLAAYEKGFSGKDRKTVDLAQLGILCDRLEEIARQMRDLLRAAPSESGSQNLEVVINSLSSFEREYDQVRKAQAAAAN